jgi:integrase
MDRATLFQKETPTISDATKARYEARYQNLRRRLADEYGKTDVTPDEVVAHLILKRDSLGSMATWRTYKAFALYVLKANFPENHQAYETLKGVGSAGLATTSARTSGQKKKSVPKSEWDQLQATLRLRADRGHQHAQGLLDTLSATLLTGLRPNEWCFSHLATHESTGRLVMHVRNSKHSNGRANGEARELFIDELTPTELATVKAAIQYCTANDETAAEKIQLALKNELDTARDVTLASTKKAGSSITFYSFRHQFIADAKLTFEDPVTISALAGHSSTKTAFEHYGKRRDGRSRIRVYPTPESVEAVQKITLETYKQFVAQRSEQSSRQPRSDQI